MQNFINKYTPKSLDEIIGHKKEILQIKMWAKDHKKPLFIFGEPGIGKTLAATLLSKEMGWEMYFTDASDDRGKDMMAQLILIASTSKTLFGKTRVIIIDEIDAISDKRGSEDYGCLSELSKILDKTKQPIILIANNPYADKKLQSLFIKCEQVKFSLPNKLLLKKFAKEVCDKEDIDYDLPAIDLLVEKAKNDVRALLIDLGTLSLSKKITLEDVENLGERQKDEDIFKIMQKIFYAKDFYETKSVVDSMDVDWKMLMSWVEENIPRQYKEPHNLNNALQKLSKADIYLGRIYSQNWTLLKYILDYLTIGIAYSKEFPEKNIGYKPFVFPTYLKTMSGNKKERDLKAKVVDKVRERYYCSKHIIQKYHLPFLEIIARSNKYTADLIYYFRLNYEEIKFLGANISEKEYNALMK
ncbi:MAG TPA: replication factor C large subunit [archaeon]|nr:replication factor C large subunit [archaeon]